MTLFRRMIGAAKLDRATYEEVEADRGATGQALLVVVLSGIAIVIGDFHTWSLDILGSFVVGTLGWMLWVIFIWLVGVKLMPEPATQSNVGELVRTTGFAASPSLLRALGLIPEVGSFVVVLAWLWTLAAMVVAVRQALDYRSTVRAVAVSVIGFIGQLIVVYIEWRAIRAFSSV